MSRATYSGSSGGPVGPPSHYHDLSGRRHSVFNSAKAGTQPLGYGGPYDPPLHQFAGNEGFLHLLECRPSVEVLLVSEKEKLMSWQQLSPISLELDYLVPRSLLHLGPLVKQVLFGPGYLTWPTPSSLASNVRTFASFGEITRTVEPFSALIGFSDSPRLPRSNDTRVYGFSFGGSCSGPRFVVLPSVGNISQTVGPFLNIRSFLDFP